MYELTFINHTL